MLLYDTMIWSRYHSSTFGDRPFHSCSISFDPFYDAFIDPVAFYSFHFIRGISVIIHTFVLHTPPTVEPFFSSSIPFRSRRFIVVCSFVDWFDDATFCQTYQPNYFLQIVWNIFAISWWCCSILHLLLIHFFWWLTSFVLYHIHCVLPSFYHCSLPIDRVLLTYHLPPMRLRSIQIYTTTPPRVHLPGLMPHFDANLRLFHRSSALAWRLPVFIYHFWSVPISSGSTTIPLMLTTVYVTIPTIYILRWRLHHHAGEKLPMDTAAIPFWYHNVCSLIHLFLLPPFPYFYPTVTDFIHHHWVIPTYRLFPTIHFAFTTEPTFGISYRSMEYHSWNFTHRLPFLLYSRYHHCYRHLILPFVRAFIYLPPTCSSVPFWYSTTVFIPCYIVWLSFTTYHVFPGVLPIYTTISTTVVIPHLRSPMTISVPMRYRLRCSIGCAICLIPIPLLHFYILPMRYLPLHLPLPPFLRRRLPPPGILMPMFHSPTLIHHRYHFVPFVRLLFWYRCYVLPYRPTADFILPPPLPHFILRYVFSPPLTVNVLQWFWFRYSTDSWDHLNLFVEFITRLLPVPHSVPGIHSWFLRWNYILLIPPYLRWFDVHIPIDISNCSTISIHRVSH